MPDIPDTFPGDTEDTDIGEFYRQKIIARKKEVWEKRSKAMAKYCEIHKEGSIKELNALLCVNYGLSFKTAMRSIYILKSKKVIRLEGDKWIYIEPQELVEFNTAGWSLK